MKNLRLVPEAQLIKPKRMVYMSNIIPRLFNFNNTNIRSEIHNGEEYWSIVDVVKALLENDQRPSQYWNDLKNGHGFAEIQLYGKTVSLKLSGSDGKKYLTDCATQENIFYIIQYIPSKKADKFKEQFAKIVNERIEEEKNPQLAVDRAVRTWQKQGKGQEWIKQRLKSIGVRNNITATWKEHGIKGDEYGLLTDDLHKGVFNKKVKEHKNELSVKGNIRDHLEEMELMAIEFAERAAANITKHRNSQGYTEVKKDVKEGSAIGFEALSKYKKLISEQ